MGSKYLFSPSVKLPFYLNAQFYYMYNSDAQTYAGVAENRCTKVLKIGASAQMWWPV